MGLGWGERGGYHGGSGGRVGLKRVLLIVALVILVVALWGTNPLGGGIDADEAIAPGYGAFETGVRRMPNGTLQVSALTRMPGVKARMVRWWFADFLQTTEHYTWWHPTDHVWMDWENKQPGQIVGASHLVHEYIGGEMQRLRIQFVDPAEFFGADPNAEDVLAICAYPGSLDEPLNAGKMCHIVRDTPWGAEMRSRFWLGYVAARDGDATHQTLLTMVANTALVRTVAVTEEMGLALMQHAIEEMGYLSDLLPDLYAREHP